MSVESSDVVYFWVLLRGLGREAAHWDGFVERFQKAFPNDRVLLDLPGTGVLVSEVSPISIPAMTESVRMQSHSSGKVYVLSSRSVEWWPWIGPSATPMKLPARF